MSQAEDIYRDFVFNDLSTDTIAQEKSVPVLSVRKTLLDYATQRTLRKCTKSWLIKRIGIPLNILSVLVSMWGMWDKLKPEELFALGGFLLVITIVVWTFVSEGHLAMDKYTSKRIYETFRGSSEGELRIRLRAFEIDSNTDFWLRASIRELRGFSLLKDAKVVEDL